MIEAFAQKFAGPLLDFANVNQHSGGRIHWTAEDEIGDVIAAAAIARLRLGTERTEVLAFSPISNK